jgi:hypothetical protein
VSFTDQQWALIKKVKGSLGTADADVIRNIVLTWLSEKSILTTSIKDQMALERGTK